MTRTKTTVWDPVDHFDTYADMVAYLEAAFEEGDPALIAAAIGDVARAKGMSMVARESGLGRESLYKSLSTGGNPELATILRVLEVLGLRLNVTRAITDGRS
jgi:probable addiction module antidote protein